jgi:hypothetical protein
MHHIIKFLDTEISAILVFLRRLSIPMLGLYSLSPPTFILKSSDDFAECLGHFHKLCFGHDKIPPLLNQSVGACTFIMLYLKKIPAILVGHTVHEIGLQLVTGCF